MKKATQVPLGHQLFPFVKSPFWDRFPEVQESIASHWLSIALALQTLDKSNRT